MNSARQPRARRPWPTSRCPRTFAGSAATSLEENGGGLGTFCIYEASSPEAIRDHAARAGLPVDEIVAIADTVIVRSDPEHAAV